MLLTKLSPQRVWYPPDTIHSYYDLTDDIPYATLRVPVTVFITGNWYFLIPLLFARWEGDGQKKKF